MFVVENDEGVSPAQHVPAWLPSTFSDAVRSCGVNPPEQILEQESKELLQQWCAPGRTYHNASYLARVISAFDELGAAAHTPALLCISIWYAGVIPPSALNLREREVVVHESCPARIQESVVALGFEPVVASRVWDLLRCAFTQSAHEGDMDAAALVDATQRDLAATPQEYKEYRRLLREEHRGLSDLDYARARRSFVLAQLKRPQLYFSPAATHWEALARQNLEAELAKLDASIAKEDPGAKLDEEDTLDPAVTTTTMVIKKVGAKDEPIIPKRNEDEAPPMRNVEDAVVPVNAGESDFDDTSTLEAEPEVMARKADAPPRRLSAKELARLARKSKEAHEDAFTASDAQALRAKLSQN